MIEVSTLWVTALIVFLILFPSTMIWLIRCAREEEPERNYSALLYAGNRAQLEKLNQNGHKGGWDMNIGELYTRTADELMELREEVVANRKLDYAAIRHEAADVANYAHMIIEKCDRELEVQNG